VWSLATLLHNGKPQPTAAASQRVPDFPRNGKPSQRVPDFPRTLMDDSRCAGNYITACEETASDDGKRLLRNQ
jgi:hypothetical protein